MRAVLKDDSGTRPPHQLLLLGSTPCHGQDHKARQNSSLHLLITREEAASRWPWSVDRFPGDSVSERHNLSNRKHPRASLSGRDGLPAFEFYNAVAYVADGLQIQEAAAIVSQLTAEFVSQSLRGT